MSGPASLGTSLPSPGNWGTSCPLLMHMQTSAVKHRAPVGAGRRSRCARLRRRHGTTLAAPPSQPDPRLGPPGPHRRLDRPPARGHRPADRAVQARERARSRRRRRRGGRTAPARDFDDEIDLRAEDDALIAAELEADAARAAEEADEDDEDVRRRRGRRARPPPPRAPRRRRRRAGGRRPSRSRAPSTTARRATGCGSTPPSPTTRSTPSTGPGHRPVEVTVEEDQIVIRRAGEEPTAERAERRRRVVPRARRARDRLRARATLALAAGQRRGAPPLGLLDAPRRPPAAVVAQPALRRRPAAGPDRRRPWSPSSTAGWPTRATAGRSSSDDATGRALAADMRRRGLRAVVPLLVMLLDARAAGAAPPALAREIADGGDAGARGAAARPRATGSPSTTARWSSRPRRTCAPPCPARGLFAGIARRAPTSARRTLYAARRHRAARGRRDRWPPHRGHGHRRRDGRPRPRARPVAAGCELVFILCHADDGPVPALRPARLPGRRAVLDVPKSSVRR